MRAQFVSTLTDEMLKQTRDREYFRKLYDRFSRNFFSSFSRCELSWGLLSPKSWRWPAAMDLCKMTVSPVRVIELVQKGMRRGHLDSRWRKAGWGDAAATACSNPLCALGVSALPPCSCIPHSERLGYLHFRTTSGFRGRLEGWH